ncbi:MAG: DUF4180 domain-containing protein [Spirochaetaceae bacterium]|nr:DUF4180 domain-containing protein [Spirochaetaceae bacterium]
MNKTAKYHESENLIAHISDFLDFIGNARYNGTANVLIHSGHLTEDFFNLKSGVAGEYLQKLSNYVMRAAIILDETHLEQPRFREMVFEANRSGDIAYFKDKETAFSWLTG